MEFVLDPPHGVGPLRFGTTAEEARAALETLGRLRSNAHGELALHLPSGLGLSVGFGVGPTRDRVNAIEVWRPTERDVVRYRGIDVFGLPALEVVERLRRYVEVVPNKDDDGFTARELYLTLWRPFAADGDPGATRRVTSSNRCCWPGRATTIRPPRQRRGWPLAANRATDPPTDAPGTGAR
jgi:hypothetical protein